MKFFAGVLLVAMLVVGVPTKATAAAARPNVLVIVVDDARFDQQFVMQRTNEWFGRGGATFVNAYSQTPLCCPSRSSIMSGRYTHNHGVKGNDLESVQRFDMGSTVQKALHDAGYQTGVVGKFFNSWLLRDAPPHFDRWAITRGGYENGTYNVDGVQQTVAQHSTDYLADRAVALVDDFNTKPAKPWFLYVAPSAPHWPYNPAPADAGAAVGELWPSPSMNEVNRNDKPPWIRNYVAPNPGYSIAEASTRQRRALVGVDRLVDRVMQRVPENTLAIFLSDNGYMLGEHGIREDKRLPYLESVRIPLLVRWPGRITPGEIDKRLVLNADVAPTIAAAAGVRSAMPRIDGRDLLAFHSRKTLLLEGYATKETPTDPGFPAWRSVLDSRGQYTEWRSAAGNVSFREFYATSDRYQMENLMVTKPTPPVAAVLMKLSLQRYADCAGTSGANACP